MRVELKLKKSMACWEQSVPDKKNSIGKGGNREKAGMATRVGVQACTHMKRGEHLMSRGREWRRITGERVQSTAMPP